MNYEPLISIIVPVYNPQIDQLDKCIRSLLNQTYSNIEIIIINDGSKTYVKEYLDQYLNYKKIIIKENKNNGVSYSRNCGIDISSGDYIIFVDCDDYLNVNTCKILSCYLDQDFDYIQFGYSRIYQNKIKEIKMYNENVTYDYLKNNNEYNPFNMKNIGMVCSKCYSKNFIGDMRFDISLQNGEDVEFNFRLFKKLKKAIYINFFFYNYVQNGDSAVRNPNSNMIENYSCTLKKMKGTLIDNQYSIELIKSYYSFVCICYLMICLNYIFSKQLDISIKERLLLHRQLIRNNEYQDVLCHLKHVDLPLTRKISLYFAKYHMSLLVWSVMKIKQIINGG